MSETALIYIAIFVFLGYIVLNFFSRSKRVTDFEKNIYLYTVGVSTFWILSNFLVDVPFSEASATFAAKVAIIFPVHIAFGFYSISQIFPEVLSVKRFSFVYRATGIFVALYTLVSLFLFNTNLNIYAIEYADGRITNYQVGPFYLGTIALVASLMFFPFVKWFSIRRKLTYLHSLQLKYLVAGLIITTFSLFISFTMLPILNLAQFIPTVFVVVIGLLYLIHVSLTSKYALVDLRQTMIKLTLWSLLVVLIAEIWTVFISISSSPTSFYSLLEQTIIVSVLLILSSKAIDSIVSKSEKRSGLLSFNRNLSVTVELEQTKNLIIAYISKLFETPFVSFGFSTRKNRQDKTMLIVNKIASETGSDILTQEYIISQYNISRSGLRKQLETILQIMQQQKVDMFIVIEKKDSFIGLITIHQSKEVLTVEKQDLLINALSSAKTALMRSMLYEEIKSFAQELEKKVRIRTKELDERLTQIEDLRRQERDMVDIMGHELRTPLSIAKLAFPRLMRFVNPKRDFKDRVPAYEKRVSDALKRETTLIETLLSATKLENKKIDLSFSPVSPADVVNNSILAFKYQAETKGLNLVVKDQTAIDKLPLIRADSTRIQEVLDNLVSNAVKYTGKGTVTVSAEKEGNYIHFSVSDTGIGIPKNAIPNLGKKFFRVSQHINEDTSNHGVNLVRPGGTGLGLFVVFGMVNAHKGKLMIKSKLGKGSTFSFTVPVMSKQAVAKAKAFAKSTSDTASSPDLFERYGLGKR